MYVLYSSIYPLLERSRVCGFPAAVPCPSYYSPNTSGLLHIHFCVRLGGRRAVPTSKLCPRIDGTDNARFRKIGSSLHDPLSLHHKTPPTVSRATEAEFHLDHDWVFTPTLNGSCCLDAREQISRRRSAFYIGEFDPQCREINGQTLGRGVR